MRWYRAYVGTVTEAKIAEVAMIAECSRSVAIATWVAILESCADLQDGGRFEITSRRIAAILGEPLKTIDAVFLAMNEVDLISEDCVPAWKKRQYESDSSTERSRRYRERNANVTLQPIANIECNADATLMQRCATPPEAETETDTEREREDTRPCAVTPSDFENGFISFFDSFPEQVNRKGSRIKALRHYQNLRKSESHDDIMFSLSCYTEDIKKSRSYSMTAWRWLSEYETFKKTRVENKSFLTPEFLEAAEHRRKQIIDERIERGLHLDADMKSFLASYNSKYSSDNGLHTQH